MDTSTYYYKSRRREQAGIETRIREICETRVRYGYRRVHVLLRREGWEINMKRTHRIYNELGLQLRNKTPKRRVKGTHPVWPALPGLERTLLRTLLRAHSGAVNAADYGDVRA
jgi:transposase InsO family protein